MTERKYTPEERKQIVSALKYAKRKLSRTTQDDLAHHICFALSTSDGAKMARFVIMERLARAVSVPNWLHRRGLINVTRYDKTIVQSYRHRWVDALIKEFSE